MSLFCGSALLLPIYGSFYIVDEYITSQLQAAVEACEYPVTTTTASQAGPGVRRVLLRSRIRSFAKARFPKDIEEE